VEQDETITWERIGWRKSIPVGAFLIAAMLVHRLWTGRVPALTETLLVVLMIVGCMVAEASQIICLRLKWIKDEISALREQQETELSTIQASVDNLGGPSSNEQPRIPL